MGIVGLIPFTRVKAKTRKKRFTKMTILKLNNQYQNEKSERGRMKV